MDSGLVGLTQVSFFGACENSRCCPQANERFPLGMMQDRAAGLNDPDPDVCHGGPVFGVSVASASNRFNKCESKLMIEEPFYNQSIQGPELLSIFFGGPSWPILTRYNFALGVQNVTG
jgi:hypothetical protein